jgi:hypothetical protein
MNENEAMIEGVKVTMNLKNSKLILEWNSSPKSDLISDSLGLIAI